MHLPKSCDEGNVLKFEANVMKASKVSVSKRIYVKCCEIIHPECTGGYADTRIENTSTIKKCPTIPSDQDKCHTIEFTPFKLKICPTMKLKILPYETNGWKIVCWTVIQNHQFSLLCCILKFKILITWSKSLLRFVGRLILYARSKGILHYVIF